MSLTITALPRYADLPAAEWAALPGARHPFVSPPFLTLLESSGSATSEEGWAPFPLVAYEGGRLVGGAPAWLKSHSWGEYVFDHPWADAYRRAGKRYYPKLLVGVPFTPVPGPRLLAATPSVRVALVRALEAVVEQNQLSSAHVNFVQGDDLEAFREAGWLLRMGVQFHWENRGYVGFDDFLAALTSHRRKELRRERRQVAAAGVTVSARSGGELTAADWRRFYALYIGQSEKKWGQPYLTEAFFVGLGERMREATVLVTAEREGQVIAAGLNLQGDEALYGRNWGASEEVPSLHFEVCYHQAVELAIRRGLRRVEAGAQGEHKLQRGYLPVATWSAHYLADPGLRQAVGAWLTRERASVEAGIATYLAHSPYRNPG